MDGDTDVLMGFVHEHWEEMRHIENQRSTLTNLILIIASALIAVIGQVRLSKDTLILTCLLVVLGIYGAVATAKLYERHQFDQNRLLFWYRRIDELHPQAQFLALRDQADQDHKARFPKEHFLVGRAVGLRLHRVWLILYGIIAATGFGLSIYTIVVYF